MVFVVNSLRTPREIEWNGVGDLILSAIWSSNLRRWFYLKNGSSPFRVQTSLSVRPLYIEPGSPGENDYIESFNGKMRDELLDREIFYSLMKAQILIEMWRKQYNTVRPHSSLGYRPPVPAAIVVQSSLINQFSLTLWLVQKMGADHLSLNTPWLRSNTNIVQ